MSRSSILLLFLATLCAAEAPLRIGTIVVEVEDVYPALEGLPPAFPYSVANLLHLRTRPDVIRRELLFAEGDPFRPELLAETERNLRRFPFLRQVRVEAGEPRDGVVDVRVQTLDAWTTKVQLNLGSSGGKLTGSGGLVEDNLLGMGKSLSAYHIVDSERSSNRLEYLDPRVLGRFLTLTLAYSTGDELRRTQASITRPFTSTLSVWSWGLSFDRRDVEEFLYDAGEESLRFRQDRWRLDGFLGRAFGSSPAFVSRAKLGWRYALDEFSDAKRAIEPLPAGFVSADRRFSGPYLGLELRQIRFIRERGIRTYGRDEDFNLGAQLNLELGLYPALFGSLKDALALGAVAQQGLAFGAGHFALGTVRFGGRIEEDGLRNGQARLRVDYYRTLRKRLTLAASAQMDWLRNPDPEAQIVMGGDEGLRGYKLRLYTGNKGMLTRVEARVLLVEDFLQVCSIGTVAFADAGNAWPRGRGMDLLDQHLDLGGGLRITFPRSSTGQILRLDLSYALDENGFDSPWLVSFGSSQSF